MALVPAWVSQFENLDEQFVPIAVQDYGARENCDHYIVVIGRPLYHAQCADAPWTRYIFCYLDETAALAVIAKIVLPVTKDFVLSRSELADKKQLTGYGEFQLVSELFLPPLSDIDDRGGLVAVWDNAGADTGVKNNNNGIFEIFVDSQETVHESWLIHSGNINSNLVCANLHASIMASCGREITNIAQYNFVNTEFASATCKKIVILPKKQQPQNEYDPNKRPVAYTILGLLQIFVEYTSLAEDDAPTTLCQVDLELTWVQRRRHRASDSETVCLVHHPLNDAANADNVTIFSLLRDRILDQREIVLGSNPRDTLLLMTTQKRPGVQQMQTLAAFVDSGSGLARLMFRVVHRDRVALDRGFVASNQPRLVEYSEYQDDKIATYTRILLHDVAYSRDNRDQQDNLIVYTIKQSNLAITSNIKKFIKEYVVTLPDRGEMQEYKARENGITTALDADQNTISFGKRAGLGFGKSMKVTVSEVCDHMNCKACSTRRLKAACNAAQKCALVNCVGTVINPNNVLCVAGSLVKEIHEVYLTNVDVMCFSHFPFYFVRDGGVF